MSIKNSVDKDFYAFVKMINNSSYDSICLLMKQYLSNLENHELYPYLLASYNAPENERFWGKIQPEKDNYELIENRAKELKDHIIDFVWLYEELSDYRSKKVLYAILASWITFNWEYLRENTEKQFKDYFDLDLIPCISEDEVFVDLGAFTGDTIADFIDVYGENFSQIIAYEVDPKNYEKLIDNTDNYVGIDARNRGAGDSYSTMYIDSSDSTTVVSDKGKTPVQIVPLDEDLDCKITWIKMDIEGSEQTAIMGLTGHISIDKPKLTICTYHNNHDIWKIPRLIRDINPDYKFYMRYNGGENTLYPCECVLYCL